MYGRGACDMKSGVAAFVAAAVDFVRETPPDGAVILAITGDEEGEGKDGTIAILDWMAFNGERMTHCLVGEPTCPTEMGEMMKIGRRGSMTAQITAVGVQGHSAYPHRAKNPLTAQWSSCWPGWMPNRWTGARRISTPRRWRSPRSTAATRRTT
jgi:succinyl-diaminopimelate desuccinylase